ncbi:hypothetical protein [Scleromatobacter humisilvae]|uniref:Uncharacterized protein n=1 Tax=Scleromatobacter humisilvae TaxID=2897159 RepID=A0A9X1YK33_9BURK|nr:hypothetical protein [Scleromatobacter humisilvae]MCK9687779.1 hypothetical protein [Scleromatobacter humisilvae]
MTADDVDEPVLRLPAFYGVALATLLGLGIALTLVVVPPRDTPVDIRFCNATDVVLTHVETYEATRFGDIAAGRCSDYRRIERGYSMMGFAAGFHGRRIERWPEDHVGGPDLPTGRHSFVIRDTANGLEIQHQ